MKRNDVVNSGIVEADGARALGGDERELSALGRARGAGFEALVERGLDVNRSAHEESLPHLWVESTLDRKKGTKNVKEGIYCETAKESQERWVKLCRLA